MKAIIIEGGIEEIAAFVLELQRQRIDEKPSEENCDMYEDMF